MNRILILIIGLMSLSVSLSADNAPISTLSNVSACPGSTITINLTVDNFTNIGAVSLRMDYNPDLMTFNDYPASFVSPSLGGALLNMVPVSSGLNKVMISWSGIPGVTMPNGSVLATLSFVLTGGNPVLSFNNSSSGGSECEYANGSGAVLNDSPSSTYYHDAIVTNTAPGPAGMIIGPGTVCQGTSNVTYTVAPIPNAATYIWTIPPGASIVSGGSTNQVTINFSPTAASGNICVLGQNICGNGAISCMVVTMNPLPGATGAISGPTSPCRGSSGIVYSIQPVPNATSYTWSVPSDWNISLGQNTTSITVNVGQVNGNVSVNAGNNCGSSVPSVLAVTAASAPAASAGNDQSVGYGGSVTLNGSATGGSGNYSWHWEPAALLVNPNVQNATTINLTSTVLFTLTVTDQASGCISNDQVLVTVSGGPLSVDATGDPNPVCSGNPVQLMALVSGGTGSNTFSWTSNPPGFTSTLPNPVATPILSTTYRVVVNDGSSTVHDSVEIIAMPLPEIPGKPAGPDTVDLKTVISSIYTISDQPSALSYLWSLSPTSAGAISGTTTTGTVNWNPAFLGNAYIKVQAINNCGASSWSEEKLTFADNTTGSENISHSGNIQVFPNPGSGTFTISLRDFPERKFSLIILNNIGATVLQKNDLTPDDKDELKVDLGYCQRGIYILVITSDHFSFRKKIEIVN